MCSPRRGPGWRIAPGVAVNRGTTPVIGTSQPWVDGDPLHHLAGEVLRVGEHVGRGEDAPGGHAVLVEQRRAPRRTAASPSTRRRARRARPCSSPRAPWVAKRASSASSARPIASHSRANTPSALAAITTSAPSLGRVHVRRRHARQHAARARAHDAAELVVGHRRLHQRGDRLVDRDVDLLADAGRPRRRRAPTACR